MGDEHGGDARLSLDAANLFPHLQSQAGVQIGKGFVQQEDIRPLDQRPCNGHPLLLPAGQLARLALEEILDLHQSGHLQGTAADLLLPLLVVDQREGDVLLHRQMGIEGIVLKHQTNAPLFWGQGRHIPVSKENPSGSRRLQP